MSVTLRMEIPLVTLHSITSTDFIAVLLTAEYYSAGQKTDQFDHFIDVLVVLQTLNLATLNSISPIKLTHFTLGCSDWLFDLFCSVI